MKRPTRRLLNISTTPYFCNTRNTSLLSRRLRGCGYILRCTAFDIVDFPAAAAVAVAAAVTAAVTAAVAVVEARDAAAIVSHGNKRIGKQKGKSRLRGCSRRLHHDSFMLVR